MEGKVFVDDKVWSFQDLDRQGCMLPPVSHRALPSIVRRGRTPQIGAGAKNSPSSQTFANMNNSVPLTQNRHFPFSFPLAEIPRNTVYSFCDHHGIEQWLHSHKGSNNEIV